MDKKYQIFISSTYKDLIEQREQVVKTVLRMGHLPVGMEMFNAADKGAWPVIQRHIDNSDYYVLILAHRYGSEDKDGVGFTEKEYDYAVSKGIPTYAFVINNGVSWPPDWMESGEKLDKLNAFKRKVQELHVNFWTSKETLASDVLFSLSEAFNISPRAGWVRSDQVTTSPLVAEEISRLSKENSELKTALAAQESGPDELTQAQRIMESKLYDFEYKGKIFSGNYFELFTTVAIDFATPASTMDAWTAINSAVIKEDIGGYNRELVKQVARPFLDTLSMIDIIKPVPLSANENTWQLSYKGKNLAARLNYDSLSS